MTTKAKRILRKMSFEGVGSSVALVGQSQGGPANGITTLVTKSTQKPEDQKGVSEEEIIQKAADDVSVNMSIMDFLVQYLDLWYDDAEIVAALLGFSKEEVNNSFNESLDSYADYIESKIDNIKLNKSATAQGFLTKHANFKQLLTKAKEHQTKTVNEEGNEPMSVEQTPTHNESIQEMINKAVEEHKAEIEKAYAEKSAKQEAELAILKAAEDRRQESAYSEKAEALKAVVGDSVDTEALAKSLRAVEALPEAEATLTVLKSLQDAQKQNGVLVEKGLNTGSESEETSESAKIENLVKSLRKENPDLPEFKAYVMACDQLREAQ